MFSGVDHKQWDDQSYAQLLEEKRPPHQVNFVQNKVLTLLGNFLQNEFEARYETELGVENDGALLLNSLYFQDKDRGDWKKAKRNFYLGGLVIRSAMEMYKDYKTTELGTVGMRYLNPNRYMFDPDWESDNINDNEYIPMFAWMKAPEIERIFGKKSEEVRAAKELYKSAVANQTDEGTIDKLVDTSPMFYDRVNNRYLVIQLLYKEYRTRQTLVDVEANKFLPQMNAEATRAMMAVRGGALKVISNQEVVIKVVTAAPGLSLSLKLEDGEHPVQIGRYPIFVWSALNLHGERQGVVDVLSDLQEIYNKRESTFTHWQTTDLNGAELVEEDFFVSPEELNNYENYKNVPGKTFKVKAGGLTQQREGISKRPRGTPPNDLHTSADRAFNMADSVSATPPAVSGGEGKSGESGRLFEAKRLQALVALEPLSQSMQDAEREITEAYFYMAKNTYSGAPRKIFNKQKNQVMFLNMPTNDGRVINDIATIQRMNVIITPSKSGVSVKRELLLKYKEALEVIQNPILHSYVEMLLVGVLPNIPENEIEMSKMLAKIFVDVQVGRTEAEKLQLQQAIQQIQSQGMPGQQGILPPGATPQEGGGFSAEGAAIPNQGGVPVDVNKQNQLR